VDHIPFLQFIHDLQ